MLVQLYKNESERQISVHKEAEEKKKKLNEILRRREVVKKKLERFEGRRNLQRQNH